MNHPKETAMELLDRYLESVRKHLPWQRQDDIIAELRSNLEAQLEEKEEALGRPLTQAEAEAWIRQLGMPLQVAAAYQPQRFLIGPSIYPTYRYVLKLACSWAAIIYSIVTAVQLFATQNPSDTALLDALLRLPWVLIVAAAWVTLIFAAIEFAVARGYLKLPALCAPSLNWTPGSLPPLGHDAASGRKPHSYAQAVAEVVFGILFLGWLLLIPQHPWLLMGPGATWLKASPFELAPVWVPFYWCVVAMNILQNGWNLATLISGRWQRPQPLKQVVFKALGLLPAAVILTAPGKIVELLRHPDVDQARQGLELNAINNYFHWTAEVICVIVVLQLVWNVVQLTLNNYRKRAAAML
jgi:hypothetical protein